jgi:predicted Zn-dependent protease
MLWYQFGPFEAYLNIGRLGDVIALANSNIASSSDLEESHYYKGRALQAQGKVREARAAYGLALKANGRHVPAWHYLSTLPPG